MLRSLATSCFYCFGRKATTAAIVTTLERVIFKAVLTAITSYSCQ